MSAKGGKKMKKLLFIIVCFFSFFLLSSCDEDKTLDEIESYKITVDQRDDGTLDLRYEIKWLVLDDTEPLEWVKIGIPNEYIGDLINLSNDVLNAYLFDDDGDFIRCDLKEKAYKNDIVTFDFKFHLLRIYTFNDETISYDFTPGWFDDIEVKKLQVLWNKNNVKDSNASSVIDDYLLWDKSLKKGEKINVKVLYDKALYPNLIETKDQKLGIIIAVASISIFVVLFIVIFIIVVIKTKNNSYEAYRGFSGENFSRYPMWYYCTFYNSGRSKNGKAINPPSSSHTSHSCACACACACAGGGRAGCSRKDFYNFEISVEFVKKMEARDE